ARLAPLFPALPQLPAELRGEFQAAGAAADDHDLVRTCFLFARHCNGISGKNTGLRAEFILLPGTLPPAKKARCGSGLRLQWRASVHAAALRCAGSRTVISPLSAARLTAESTARKVAVTMLPCIPAPYSVCSRPMRICT